MSENPDIKKPQDRKKPHHPRSEKFTFTYEGGTIEIPYVENLTRDQVKMVAETARTNEADAEDALFKEIMTEEAYANLGSMTLGEYDDFTNAWNEESSISLGE